MSDAEPGAEPFLVRIPRASLAVGRMAALQSAWRERYNGRALGRALHPETQLAPTRNASERLLAPLPPAGKHLSFSNLEVMRHLCGLAEHDRGRAVFFRGKGHGTFDLLYL
jgi:hypothetical protein